MKPSPSPVRRRSGSIEPLEARIAPATIIIGVPNLNGESNEQSRDTEYTESGSPFVNMGTGVDQISTTFGRNPNTFYLRLEAGDLVQRFTEQGIVDYIRVTSGKVVAFFQDQPGPDGAFRGEFDSGELTGFSVSDNAGLIFKDVLNGDVVNNLLANGQIGQNFLSGGGAKTKGIQNLEFRSGDITGRILSGGPIASASVNGVTGIYAGTAAIGQSYDFFPALPGGNGTIAPFAMKSGVPGSSISNIVVDRLIEMKAGNGGLGANGGALNNIEVISDLDGMSLVAGNGGAAGPRRPNGGAGGAISNVFISNQELADTLDNNLISLKTGIGGNAVAGRGGEGGNASSIYVGLRRIGPGSFAVTSNLLHDNVELITGAGGNGRTAGSGGDINLVRMVVSTPDTVEVGGVAVNEISLLAGKGGNSTGGFARTAGAGGFITDAQIRNQAIQDQASPTTGLPLPNADILVDAGDGGTAAARATGGRGGDVTNSRILGSDLTVQAGNGTSGRIGGAGGSLVALTVLQETGIFARTGVFNAGEGGDAVGRGGAGGRGGSVNTLITDDADFTSFVVNAGTAANGGDSRLGNGGAGGPVRNVQLFESDSRIDLGGLATLSGAVVVRTGTGGNGFAAGGAGGALQSNTIVTTDMSATLTTGNGGNSTFSRNGGSGGALSSLNLTTSGDVLGVPAFASVETGDGGNAGRRAIGVRGAGGAGGAISLVNINASGAGTLIAGDGGNGSRGAAGAGGSILLSGVFAGSGDILGDAMADSSGVLRAGDAGLFGLRPGVGGSISGTDSLQLSGLFATASVTIEAGNGSIGGAGGSIKFVGYGAANQALVPVPSGNILVKAGDGSVRASGGFAGAGGSISVVAGAVTSGESVIGTDATTIIQAGKGGGNGRKSAPGGSVSALSLERGPDPSDPGGILTIAAGDAGNAGGGRSGRFGAAGGSVSNITVLGLGDNTVIRSIAAGDASSGTFRGGAGGNVSEVRVLGSDIGVKAGAPYGYNSMGGIFAGLGGLGGPNRAGVAGSVVDISADSISAIVAGKGAAPGLAQTVERITLNAGPVLPAALSTSPNSSFFLTVNGVNTALLPGNALPQDVENALNALSVVDDRNPTNGVLDGVDVVATPNSSYQIAFRASGDQPQITATRQFDGASTVLVNDTLQQARSENVDLLGVGTFELFVASTNERTGPLPANATPQEVEAALNAIPTISSFGGVTVTRGVNTSYDIHFNLAGADPSIGDNPDGTPRASIGAREFSNLLSTTLVQGTATVGTVTGIREIQAVNFPLLRYANPGGLQLAVNGAGVASLPGDATAAQLEAALNASPVINDNVAGNGRDGVFVSLTADNTFSVRFVNPADDAGIDITAVQVLPAVVTELANGGASFAATETTSGSGTAREIQRLTPTSPASGDAGQPSAPFTLSFDGQSTPRLAANPSASAVQTALNALGSVAAAGGVAVFGTATTGYDIIFNVPGARNQVTGTFAETQRVDVTNSGLFQLALGSNPGTFTAPLPKNASPEQVQAQLNVIAPGQVTVDPSSGANGVYLITFNGGGDQPPLQVVETRALTATQGPVVTLKYTRDTTFLPPEFNAASIVGAIADFNELGADVFKFIDANGDGRFTLGNGSGDRPIDGLIAARTFNTTAPTNFTPEARYVLRADGADVPRGTEFFDFNNQR